MLDPHPHATVVFCRRWALCTTACVPHDDLAPRVWPLCSAPRQSPSSKTWPPAPGRFARVCLSACRCLPRWCALLRPAVPLCAPVCRCALRPCPPPCAPAVLLGAPLCLSVPSCHCARPCVPLSALAPPPPRAAVYLCGPLPTDSASTTTMARHTRWLRQNRVEPFGTTARVCAPVAAVCPHAPCHARAGLCAVLSLLFRDAFEGEGPQRRPQQRLGMRLEGFAKAVGGRVLSVTNAVEGGTCRRGRWLATSWAPRVWGVPPPFPMHPCPCLRCRSQKGPQTRSRPPQRRQSPGACPPGPWGGQRSIWWRPCSRPPARHYL